MTEPAKNIVIIGGGFAGRTVARELRRRLPHGYTLILISEESYLTFNPLKSPSHQIIFGGIVRGV